MLMRAEGHTPQGSACDPCRDASAAEAAGFWLLASATRTQGSRPWSGLRDAAFELQFSLQLKRRLDTLTVAVGCSFHGDALSGRPAGSKSPESMRQLLRQILRAHRTKLPPNMRSLGDQYVRKEFAEMRDVTKPEVLERFRDEWEKYLQQLETAPADDLGADLDAEILGTMSDDQKAKLVDMRASSRKLREEDGK